MNPDPMFTDPAGSVQWARIAMARAQRRLALDEDPLNPCLDVTLIGLAFLSLETVHPPYPPLVDTDVSVDPGADIANAVMFLRAAIAETLSAANVARFAATIDDLSELACLGDFEGYLEADMLPEDPGFDGCTPQWP
jgi:hypothetical protein